MPARQPIAKARLTGADKKNPQRYRDRANPPTSGDPVGEPPAYLSRDAKAAWREAADCMAWLVREDRLALEVAANAVAAVRECAKAGETPTAAMLTAARQSLSALGGTPADRSKVHLPAGDDDEGDPWAQFERPLNA